MSLFKTSRYLAAPPSAVFAAIRDPERLARWWGPRGFTNRFDLFEFHPHGQWRFDMVGPDGVRYPNLSQFLHIEVDRQVVIQHINPPHFQLTLTLDPAAGGTLLHWEQVFADAEVAKAVAPIVEPANEQNLDRLSLELGCAPAETT
jgi:uncharacterized protein YndB with AHSA1/START domain